MTSKLGNARFGQEVRKLREARGISLRALAKEVGMQPAYVSKVETGKVSPSENFAQEASKILGESPEVLLSYAGRTTSRLAAVIAKNPKAFSDLLFQLENAPDNVILRVTREVRDGEW